MILKDYADIFMDRLLLSIPDINGSDRMWLRSELNFCIRMHPPRTHGPYDLFGPGYSFFELADAIAPGSPSDW